MITGIPIDGYDMIDACKYYQALLVDANCHTLLRHNSRCSFADAKQNLEDIGTPCITNTY